MIDAIETLCERLGAARVDFLLFVAVLVVVTGVFTISGRQ